MKEFNEKSLRCLADILNEKEEQGEEWILKNGSTIKFVVHKDKFTGRAQKEDWVGAFGSAKA